MNASIRDSSALYESSIHKAISDFKLGVYPSLRAAAIAFSIPIQTLRDRMKGVTSRSAAHEYRQALSPAEEDTLFKWITHLTRTGYPISPMLAQQIAEEIRCQRYQLSKHPPSQRPLGQQWLIKFKSRHPLIQGVWTRKIANSRHKAMSSETVKSWFEAVTSLSIEHQYPPERRYNMDESGFAVGDSQSSRALVNIREESS